jgi:5-oxoprolinase (ATP-hydrolysing)
MADQAGRSGRGWRFWIDRGGTFTDVVGCDPAGRLQVRKVLSEQPERAGDPAVAAIRELVGLAADAPLPPGLVAELRLGTTVATNALLEHRGVPVLLLINRGLADLLTIGDQHRPDIFALAIKRPRPLDVRVLEVSGRVDAAGAELEPLRLDADLAEQVRAAQAAGYRSCAVALLHSSRNPEHERQLGDWLAPFGFGEVALSHQLSSQPRLVPRGHTTLVEAAVAPVLDAYLAQVRAALGAHALHGPRLRVMRSSGALAAPDQLHAKDTILSGPAGGMVGAVAVARQALAAAGLPEQPVVGFDMGGTSTDVFHFDPGRGALAWERLAETEVAGLRLQAPMLPIHTVAAGGGSIVHFDGERLLVGPESAGANPGPAAYRRGGPATVTDANLLLGRLPAQALPAVFGPGGDQPADLGAVRTRFAELAASMAMAAPGTTAEQVAAGALRIAIERMAAAIRRVSIQRGHDLRGALLVSYGGAGGQHACRLAEALGIARVLLHPLAGVLSAYGIGMAEQRVLLERAPRRPLDRSALAALRLEVQQLRRQAEQQLRLAGDLDGDGGEALRCQVRLELRPAGSEQGLEVAWPEGLELSAGAAEAAEAALLARLGADFAALHLQRYGYRPQAGRLVVERLLLEVAPLAPTALTQADPSDALPDPAGPAPAPQPTAVPVWLERHGGWQPVPLLGRDQLRPGRVLAGPAVVRDATTSTLLEPGWRARLLAGGVLLLQRDQQVAAEGLADEAAASGAGLVAAVPTLAAPDPTLLELYNHRFAAIAEQMGVRLQQSARSVNIRERLDFSCALFDGQGRLVANAPHIPVHLGSMGESVAALLAAIGRGERAPLGLGDVVLSNDPYAGGTHLPDITAITPVFAGGVGAPPPFYVASRGHHADVGGITPGSMPAFSNSIHQEGLLLCNEPFLVRGQFDAPAWRQRLLAGPRPVRNVDQLLADLQAQAAANQLGVGELERLVRQQGLAEVQAYMGHVQANAAAAVRRAIAQLQDGSAVVELDDGSRIQVTVAVDQQHLRARIDCSGTSPQHPGNLNAPLAITKAVVLYGFRCLVGEAIPLNAGCFEPLELVVPEGCLLNPRFPAAVVAGNVETSQALANALFLALGVQAAAQGTMNNLSFGNAERQYYETICGGTGAGCQPGGAQGGVPFAGASAVHSHMTNSRLTDPEVLEERFPVRLECFAIRRGSGGRGQWPGGDGVVRELRFLEPMTVSLLSSSRRVPPAGLAGGGPGACGRNQLLLPDGRTQELPGCTELEVPAGALLRIATPGGGGYGPLQP